MHQVFIKSLEHARDHKTLPCSKVKLSLAHIKHMLLKTVVGDVRTGSDPHMWANFGDVIHMGMKPV